MKYSFLSLLFIVIAVFPATAQRRSGGVVSKAAFRPARSAEIGQSAIVVDETLSVLRKEPSLFSEPVHRMQRGRKIQILGVTEADGVKFYKVTAPPTSFGWVQADAVFGKFRPADEERFAKLVQATDGFDQIEMATQFFETYPDSRFKPQVLMLFGDLLEEVAAKLTKDANSRLRRPEMAASAAPMHSYFLNFVSLDRYRKLGIIFLFNSSARAFHYNGASWKEIVTKFPKSPEAVEAQKRLDNLALKMQKPVVAQ
jgi:hypothetical protein